MNDRRQNEEKLAAWAGQVLGQLPPRKAPTALAPRVLAALARRQAVRWFQRPWMNWPRHLQMMSFLLFTGMLAGIAWFILPHADAVGLASAKETLAQTEGVRSVSTTMEVFSTLGGAVLTVLRYMNTWLLAGVLGGLALLWCSCLGLGTACWRLAGPER
jgi:hypothetical protein